MTKFYDRLSTDLTRLLEDPIDYNVTIEKFNETPFNDDHIKELTMENTNISIKMFNIIIKYIYGGTISLEKLENSVIFDLLIASDELKLDELVEYLQTYLIVNNASWLRLNFAKIYRTSYKFKNSKIIQEFCNDIIVKHPNTIFESEYFHSISEDALISILKRDDLQLEEGKILEYVIQWGKAKNPTLPSDIKEWTNNNFLTLKETLKGCLPHIRYFSISGDDVIEKIYPYQQLLEQ
ncbi:hypothetical protein Glove_350g171 [Diversispora epigaea]|uniref:BACK domain-containing protein n=1 Tax=Diversispora epigaea TaxID=1348612 RepID=A0A397HCM8_9GLOM|nr:hypothetical protein Glove_350g171 [Diversispora epigaea]